MPLRHRTVSLVMLVDGVLLIVLGFLHLVATPLVRLSLAGELTVGTFSGQSAPSLFNHIFIGVLLIPFGLSTLYSAAGVRAGQRWARGIAIVNALGVLAVPFVVAAVGGIENFSSPVSMMAAVLITVIGLSMFLPLLWLPARRPEDR
jgi:hypothetical protein